MSNKFEVTQINSQVIKGAISGDSIAMKQVLSYYQKYMTSLSLRKNNQLNNSSLQLDEFMYRRLETKLMEKVLKFDQYR